MQLTLILFPIALAIYGAIIYLFVLLVKALRKYIKSKDVREEKKAVCRSLGEALKAHRTEKQMTQEFVAETLGVAVRRSASGRTARPTPARRISARSRSSTASRSKNCCMRRRRRKARIEAKKRQPNGCLFSLCTLFSFVGL